jgi:hypothetical protein
MIFKKLMVYAKSAFGIKRCRIVQNPGNQHYFLSYRYMIGQQAPTIIAKFEQIKV